MNRSTRVRAAARRLHRQAAALGHISDGGAQGLPPSELLARVAALTGIERVALPAGDPLLYGSLATLMHGYVMYNEDVASWFAHYCQAHEYAHHVLQHGRTHCTREDIEGAVAESDLSHGERRITGYGPQEMREREANLFARELLLPSDVLRRWFIDEELKAGEIANRTGLPPDMVCQQLSYALLVADAVDGETGDPGAQQGAEAPAAGSLGSQADGAAPQADGAKGDIPRFSLDDSQRRAAHAPSGPLLIEAGPGTGKTRALVGRVLHLLDRSVRPENILALTFSNKAAEEMRERVRRAAPEAADHIWMGTFHAFGFELLRKYWQEAGLEPKAQLLDPIDAIFALEDALPELRMDHYQHLPEPTKFLGSILEAIGRAKDEMADPADYRKLAGLMLEGAADSDGRVVAEKALEVARVYGFYQAYLDQRDLLDFGDLIFRTVRLLRESDAVRDEVRRRYREILVDEYQDVNRASGLLLREIAGDGRGLWAVGDVRQSLYRWRGASPANTRLFAEDFPGARVLTLEVNYRSQPPVVEAVRELAPQMHAARTPGAPVAWRADRAATGGSINYEIVESWEAEAQYLASEIKHHQSCGVQLRQQAIICRSHGTLNRVAAALERENIPLLYLGDLFERPEIRDMLSLLSLSSEGDGRGLLRVARFRQYDIPLCDVRRLIALADEHGRKFPEAFGLAEDCSEMEEAVREKFGLLKTYLGEPGRQDTPWQFLSRYLFDGSDYLRPYLADNSVAGRQRRFALYQFLQFAAAQPAEARFAGLDPRQSALRYIRRLEMFGEERNYRQLPEWAEEIDAVRLLTIHASKGLEFDVVYMPYLSSIHLPATPKPRHCPPPAGMIEGYTDPKQEHEEEEQCLFFVALSRARDTLCLSRAAVYGKRNLKASRFLDLIERRLPRLANAPVSWRPAPESLIAAAEPPSSEPPGAVAPQLFTAGELNAYMSCPRRYFYEYVLRLSGRREDTAYVQFHACVYDTISWMRDERRAAQELSEGAAVERLDSVWAEKGPAGHPYESIYLDQARTLVTRAVELHADAHTDIGQPRWVVTLGNGRVAVTPDMVEISDGKSTPRQVTVQRIRTGRAPKKLDDNPLYGLYLYAARAHEQEAECRVRVVYLSSGDGHDAELSDKKIKSALSAYESAIDGITRRQFPPKPDSMMCPSCAHYFICPSAEDSPPA